MLRLLKSVKVLCGFLVMVLFQANTFGEQSPNIVFILADNQSAQALSVYGNRDVSMPNIEQLAARGLRFDNAFASSGMCSPTRATLLTGLMPSQHGLHNALHDEWVDQQTPGWSAIKEYDSLPQSLKRSGYQTAMIGKWHIGDPKTAAPGFDHWVALPYGHTRDFWHNQLMDNGTLLAVDDQHIVDVLASRAVDYLSTVDGDSPFFLQLSLDGPYALPPTNYGPAKNRFYEQYREQSFQSMPLQSVNDNVLSRLTGPFIPEHAIENGIEDMSLDEIWNSILYRTIRMQGDRQSYANFLSQNTVVDAAVGRVWKSLVDRGLDKNTVVIYSADQGNLYGQHGSWGHTIWFWPSHLYDTALNIPLIIYHPDRQRAGQVSNRLIAQYDIAPTVLALAKSNHQFENSPGRSFSGAISKSPEQGPANDAVFYEQEETRGIRTLKFAYWKRVRTMGEPELYDLQADPGQLENIYASYPDRAVVQQLDAELEAFFTRYSTAEYNLWEGGVPKGTTPNPIPWLKIYPWAWTKKLWADVVMM